MAFQFLHGENCATISITTPLLNPAEAEIHISFHLTEAVVQPELRGRLMGPRCPYATTVEIAYPFRPLPRSARHPAKTVTGRVIIPEPSFWDPVSPFLYQGPIELWAEGKPLVQLRVSHGLRELQGAGNQIRWNGKPVVLNGLDVEQADESQALRWHRAGFNTWLVKANEKTEVLCELADRYGFWVRIAVEGSAEQKSFLALAEHACFLDWVKQPP